MNGIEIELCWGKKEFYKGAEEMGRWLRRKGIRDVDIYAFLRFGVVQRTMGALRGSPRVRMFLLDHKKDFVDQV